MNPENKLARYSVACRQVESILGPEGYQVDLVGRMAIASAILKMQFPEWVFVGFYRFQEPDSLVIGPYQGELIACGTITLDHGVCGASARVKETLIVDDVTQYPGYISCDELTQSEIVVPLLENDRLIGVLDIDGAAIGEFDAIDKKYLAEFVALILATN